MALRKKFRKNDKKSRIILDAGCGMGEKRPGLPRLVKTL